MIPAVTTETRWNRNKSSPGRVIKTMALKSLDNFKYLFQLVLKSEDFKFCHSKIIRYNAPELL